MPFGRYTVLDDGEPVGTEEFRCARSGGMALVQPDPDLGPVTRRDAGLRGGRRVAPRPRPDRHGRARPAQTRAGRRTLQGFRDRRPIEIGFGPDVHLDYFTPTTNAITTHRLDGTAEIDVVYLEPVTLESSRVRQRAELVGDERVERRSAPFDATRWRFTALDSGRGSNWTSDLWVAGDIVVRYGERLFELEWLDPGATGPRPIA